jgi:hypothetical protein
MLGIEFISFRLFCWVGFGMAFRVLDEHRGMFKIKTQNAHLPTELSKSQ